MLCFMAAVSCFVLSAWPACIGLFRSASLNMFFWKQCTKRHTATHVLQSYQYKLPDVASNCSKPLCAGTRWARWCRSARRCWWPCWSGHRRVRPQQTCAPARCYCSRAGRAWCCTARCVRSPLLEPGREYDTLREALREAHCTAERKATLGSHPQLRLGLFFWTGRTCISPAANSRKHGTSSTAMPAAGVSERQTF